MRLVATRRVGEGAVLARDVMTGRHGAVPLVRTGTPLGPRYVSAIERAGINAVYVEDAVGEGIEVTPILTEQTRAQATRVLERALTSVRPGDERASPLPVAAVDALTEVARLIANELATCDDVIVALQDLAAADAYTMQHSIDVTALGILVGRRLLLDSGWIDFRGDRRFERLEERIVQLGLGLILHDVGKLTVPQDILNKQGPLSEEEWELMRMHPLAGLDLVGAADLSAITRTAIRSHHERWNGSGYPDRLAGAAIHQFARVAAVADVYDAVTSERAHQPARPPHVGWHTIVDGAGTLFAPEVVDAFRRVVAPYPPGSEIPLPDGCRGVVVSVEPDAPEAPLVRVAWAPDGTPLTPYEIRVGAGMAVAA